MPLTAQRSLHAALLAPHSAERRRLPALRRGATVYTYAELETAVTAAVRRLGKEGIRPRDRVLLCFENSPELVISLLAASFAGAIAVPVDPGAGAARLSSIVDDTAPRFCLAASGLSLPESLAVPRLSVDVATKDRRLGISSRMTPRAAGFRVPARGAPDEPALILFSAGTTGRPKGVVLKHKHLLHVAKTLSDLLGLDSRHRELILSPLTHSGGLQRVTATLYAGGCVVFPSGLLSVQNILEHVQRRGVHGFFAPPPILRALLKTPAAKVRAATGTLRSVESASAPLAPEELRRLLDLLPRCRILFQYGLTECSRAFMLDARAHTQKLKTVGLATPGVEAMIMDAAGKSSPPGETGEVWLRGPQRCDGYWNRPELDRGAFSDGWLKTGDYGSLDADGFLSFRGRRDDRINCGGLNYFPAEVERELGRVEGLRDYLVAGVPDPQGMLNQVPWAFVVPDSPGKWSPETMLEAARRKLPAHMRPRNIVVIPAIPMIAGVKADRLQVVERYGPARHVDPRADPS